jgi:spore coat polysaccharide biosynthesis protein SpsF
MTKIVAIVQARMGSTRLPGKVLLPLLGEPMLVQEMARIGRSKRISSTIVATTHLPADDRIVDLCRKQGWQYCRGSEQDVLDRYYHCARQAGADVVVRLTSDCPLIEPAVIDRVIEAFARNSPDVDYVSNVLPPRTFPRGLDTEVFSFAALERSWKEDKNPLLREHVTQYMVQNPDKFRISGITNTRDLSGLRWTVDTKEDFRLVTEIYSHFGHNRFSMEDVLSLMEKRPELLRINQDIPQKEVSHP